MKKWLIIGCAWPLLGMGHKTPDSIYYISLNKAVHQGFHEGTADVGELLEHGDFGLGSEAALASELVLLDGTPYAFSADGTVKVMKRDERLAFAATKFFKPEKKTTLNGIKNLRQLEKALDSIIVYNGFCAIRITGSFSYVQYHCYTKQERLHVPTKHATVFLFEEKNVQGTLVGFHTPKIALVLNSPDYHFHFVNAARTHGGHLRKCTADSITVEVDYADHLEAHLPDLRRFNVDK